MSIYDELAEVTRELLDPDILGAQAGAIALVIKQIIEPENSWDAPEVVYAELPLRGQAFGVSSELVGLPALEPSNGVVLASDRVVICEVPAPPWPEGVPFEDGSFFDDGAGFESAFTADAGATLSIDGKPVTVLRAWRIPAAGVASAVKFVVR